MDSKLFSLFPHRYYIDIIDNDWILDELSDDEVDIPIDLEQEHPNLGHLADDILPRHEKKKQEQWIELDLEDIAGGTT